MNKLWERSIIFSSSFSIRSQESYFQMVGDGVACGTSLPGQDQKDMTWEQEKV